LVFLCDVYHHIEYPSVYMAALLEVLEPGGDLVLVDFQRIEGVTSKPMLKHIRASKETVIEEVRSVGFELIGETDLGLEENYVLRFRRPG
jgi:predicted methyltransferase